MGISLLADTARQDNNFNGVTKMNELQIGEKNTELALKTKSAIERCKDTVNIWSRSRSGTNLKNMTVGGHLGPMRMMRQIAAELQSKQAALSENKFKILKKQKQIQIRERDIDKEKDELKKDLLQIEIDKLKANVAQAERPYVGAMREVVALAEMHDKIKLEILNKYGKLDEEVFELEEAKYWVRRSFDQCLRDIRHQGAIGSGNQELLEQIGLNPSAVIALLTSYLNGEGEKPAMSGSGLHKFLDECADEYYPASKERLKLIGLPTEINKDVLVLTATEEA